MGRIPQERIERLNRETALERVVAGYGVELSAESGELAGRCPIHLGGDSGFVVDPAANTWRCGTCNESGTVLDLVVRLEGVSLTHAVTLLEAGKLGLTRRAKSSRIRRLASPLDAGASDGDLLAQVADYYHAELKEAPEALAYLERRGINSSDAIETFKLGFSNRTLGYRIPEKNRRTGKEIRSQLQRLGVIRPSGHELFRGSIIVPVFDEHGKVVQLHGRKITPDLRPGTADHTQLPGGTRGVWNRTGLAASTIVLCQSFLDALTVWCAGIRNVAAIPGLDAFTEEHLDALKTSAKEVLVAFRRDEEGDRAAAAIADRLGTAGIACSRVQFPHGMDANDFALKNAPASKGLARVFRNAVWLAKGKKPDPKLEDVAEGTTGTARLEQRDPPARRSAARAVEPTDDNGPAKTAGEPASSPVAQHVPEPAAIEPAPLAEPDVPVTIGETEVVIEIVDRRYRVRGLARNMSYDSLKVNVLASRVGVEQAGFHVDTLDLYQAKVRTAFAKEAARELGLAETMIKNDLGKLLLKLEGFQEAQIRETLKPKVHEVGLDEAERDGAMALLSDPNLLDRILMDFERCGVVGEESNKLVGYLAAVSRKLDDPLAILIQSSSAAGKTSLMDAILAFVPEEDRVHFSAMTGQSLFYMGETTLKHKILAIAEEEGAQRASYALKLLQSEKHISIASTAKEASTGRLVTQQYRVEGPTQLMLTTTAAEIDEELLNRCIVLTVDEDREQTRAIHRLQRERETLDGILHRSERAAILKVHQDAQRLLRPLLVANPFATELTFRDDQTRTRRDHAKYLALIRAVTLLHQYRRPIRSATQAGKAVPYIEVTPDDVAVANRLAHLVLGRSLDVLPPQTRRLLLALDKMVREECEREGIERGDYRFTRRFARERLAWGDTQLKIHLRRLVELEYVLVHRAGPSRRHVFELVYDGEGNDGTPFLTGLIDASKLETRAYDGARAGSEDSRAGSGRATGGPRSGGGRRGEIGESSNGDAGFDAKKANGAGNGQPGSLDGSGS